MVETYDNGEFYTTTVLKVDSILLRQFLTKYQFDTLKVIYPSHFLGEHSLKIKPDFNNLNGLFYTRGTKGKNSWFYIVDVKQSMLWAEVQYPDMAGD